MKLFSKAILCFLCFSISAQEEMPTGYTYVENHLYQDPVYLSLRNQSLPDFSKRRRLQSTTPRNLLHLNVQSSQLYGNSSDLQYFYTNIYFGTNQQRESLIVDTGSSMAAVPCKNYCKR